MNVILLTSFWNFHFQFSSVCSLVLARFSDPNLDLAPVCFYRTQPEKKRKEEREREKCTEEKRREGKMLVDRRFLVRLCRVLLAIAILLAMVTIVCNGHGHSHDHHGSCGHGHSHDHHDHSHDEHWDFAQFLSASSLRPPALELCGSGLVQIVARGSGDAEGRRLPRLAVKR